MEGFGARGGRGREEGKLRSSDDSAAIFVQLALPYVLGGKIPVREGTLVSQAYLQHQHRRGDWAKQGILIQDGHERLDDKPIRDQARERSSICSKFPGRLLGDSKEPGEVSSGSPPRTARREG